MKPIKRADIILGINERFLFIKEANFPMFYLSLTLCMYASKIFKVVGLVGSQLGSLVGLAGSHLESLGCSIILVGILPAKSGIPPGTIPGSQVGLAGSSFLFLHQLFFISHLNFTAHHLYFNPCISTYIMIMIKNNNYYYY